MIYCCAQRPWSRTGVIYQFLVRRFGRLCLLFRDGLPRARGMAAYVRYEHRAFRQPKFESGCCEMLVFKVFGA